MREKVALWAKRSLDVEQEASPNLDDWAFAASLVAELSERLDDDGFAGVGGLSKSQISALAEASVRMPFLSRAAKELSLGMMRRALGCPSSFWLLAFEALSSGWELADRALAYEKLIGDRVD